VTDAVVIPPAPAVNLWDVQAVAASALAVLRLGSGDVDEGRVEAAAMSACTLIDHDVDRLDPITPTANMNDSAVQVTVELYRRKDGPFGTTDAWSQDTVPVVLPGSPLTAVLGELLPDKQRWGLA
jgi:hypothetical protein